VQTGPRVRPGRGTRYGDGERGTGDEDEDGDEEEDEDEEEWEEESQSSSSGAAGPRAGEGVSARSTERGTPSMADRAAAAK